MRAGYSNERALPPGRILIVGSGQSGCQIAEELHLAGREVVLSCGRAPWVTRRVGDRVNLEVDTVARYVARLMDRAQTGKNPGQ